MGITKRLNSFKINNTIKPDTKPTNAPDNKDIAIFIKMSWNVFVKTSVTFDTLVVSCITFSFMNSFSSVT